MSYTKAQIEVEVSERIGFLYDEATNTYTPLAGLNTPLTTELIDEGNLGSHGKKGKVFARNKIYVFKGAYNCFEPGNDILPQDAVVFDKDGKIMDVKVPICADQITLDEKVSKEVEEKQINYLDLVDFIHLTGTHEAEHTTSENIKILFMDIPDDIKREKLEVKPMEVEKLGNDHRFKKIDNRKIPERRDDAK